MSDARWLSAAEAAGPARREAPDALRLREPWAVRRERVPGQPDQPLLPRRRRAPRRARPRPRRRARARRSSSTRPSPPSTRPVTSRTAGWDATRAATDARYEEVAAWLWGTTFGPTRPLGHADPDGLALARAVQAALPADDATPRPAPRRGRRAAARRSAPQRPARAVGRRARRARCSRPWSRRSRRSTRTRHAEHDRFARAPALDPRVTARADDAHASRALDRALSLLADHELATSTLARARRRVDVGRSLPPRSSPASRPPAAAARRRVGVRRARCSATRSPTDAEHAVGPRARATTQRVPGFGHSVYEGPDPRAPVLLDAVRAVPATAPSCGAPRRACST